MRLDAKRRCGLTHDWTLVSRLEIFFLRRILKCKLKRRRMNETMNHRASAAALAVLAAVPLFIWGCASSKPITVEDAAYPASKVDARGLFQENCVMCHGANGRAHTFHGRIVGAQNLTDSKWQAETSDAQIVNAIKTGPSVMPAFGKKLSESEIDALAVYVRSFGKTP